MPDLFPIDIDQQIACVTRELGYRERVYARRIGAGKMTQRLADREMAAMKAVLETLRRVRQGMVRSARLEDQGNAH
jgi:hypothetical protein